MPISARQWRCSLLCSLLLCLLTPAGLVAQDGLKVKRFKKLELAQLTPDSVLSLDLSGQRLKEFPAVILEMKNLKELRLKKCKLTSIPDISSLSNLQVLDLGSNKLDTIHPSIYSLTGLEKLRIGNNQISEVDARVAELTQLKYLDLWGNMLSDLPEEMKSLSKLVYMDMRVMEINSARQERISNDLPHCRVFFSAPCNCMD